MSPHMLVVIGTRARTFPDQTSAYMLTRCTLERKVQGRVCFCQCFNTCNTLTETALDNGRVQGVCESSKMGKGRD